MQNVPNGLPPQQFKPTTQVPSFNGVHSSHSSRDSSPAARPNYIPPSQLPPGLTQSFQQLNVNTPSPRAASFGSSTPVSQQQPNFLPSNACSPVTRGSHAQTQQSGFSNTAASVPLSFSSSVQQQGGVSQNLLVSNAARSPPVPSSLGTKNVGSATNVPTSLSYGRGLPASNMPVNTAMSTHASSSATSYVQQQPLSYTQSGGAAQFTNPSQGFPSASQYPKTSIPQSASFQNQFSNVPLSQPQVPSQPYQNYATTNMYQNFSKTSLHSNRYPNAPQQPQQQPYNGQEVYQQPQYSVPRQGFNKMWGTESYDLLQTPNILPPTKVDPPKISLGQDYLDAANCDPEIFRCTLTKIPETNSLLQKSRLPLGILIHPFKDLNHLPVIQCNVIVRCRACRTYINPFVFFMDSKRWKCNLCYRVNELPEEFQYDPVSKTYGDPSRRPEIKSSTIEYIAPAEYMLRPPQPAVYLFLFDVSRLAVESGYLETFCEVLSAEIGNLPGDSRTQVGFLAYDSALHFFALNEGLSRPHEMIVVDTDEIFLPCPENLLVNLKDKTELVLDLLSQLPTRYVNNYDDCSAMGAALQAAHRLMASSGGRITVFQATLPNREPGGLQPREDPSQRASGDVKHLNPVTDFYKKLAVECSSQQVAVDLFLVNSQFVDVATISGISRFSGGCLYQFPLFKASRVLQNEAFKRTLRRYLTRKIGFEAVMRVRCTRGLAIQFFHGNLFVRSTDLISLPNINPDAGFGMQVAIEESLTDVQTVCFQAALLYTSSKGERRIRVHTLCVPTAATLPDVLNSADQQCIVGLLAKMAVDRSMAASLSDAREALVNVAIDVLSTYKMSLNLGTSMSGLLVPNCLKLLPLYISALLKFTAFRTGTSTRLDDRVKAMCDMKTKPLGHLMQMIYPDLYAVHNLEEQPTVLNEEEEPVPQPPHLQLTARNIDSNGAYLLDAGESMVLMVCPAVSPVFLNQALGVSDYNSITDDFYELPILENPHNHRLNCFVNYLNEEKPFAATLQIIRENSVNRNVFYERLIEDRVDSALSYHEFLQHLKTQVK